MIIAVLLIGLKLAGLINLPWVYVLIPIYIYLGLILLLIFVLAISLCVLGAEETKTILREANDEYENRR